MLLLVAQTEDGLVHLEWWSREDENAAGPEFDSIIFPEEAEWTKVCHRGHRKPGVL